MRGFSRQRAKVAGTAGRITAGCADARVGEPHTRPQAAPPLSLAMTLVSWSGEPVTLHVCLHTAHCALCTLWCCVSRRFYETDSAIKIGMMEAFKKLAVDPESLPDIIFASIGRTILKVCVSLCGMCRTHDMLCQTGDSTCDSLQSDL